MTRTAMIAGALLATALLAVACNGGNDGAKTPAGTAGSPVSGTTTPPAGASPSSAQTAQPTAATAAPASPTNGQATAPSGDSGGDGRVYTETEARAALDEILLKPADIGATWSIQTDNTADNATAKANDPRGAAGVDRCGRLLGRTITLMPQDSIAAFLAGETLSFFSTATVYATAAGAADCAAEAATRYTEPGELARAFGQLFIDPDAVQVALTDWPPVAEGSFAATLTGQINAAGTTIDLTLLIVGFRSGNTSVVVGSARSGATPPKEELSPLVDLVLQRVTANQ